MKRVVAVLVRKSFKTSKMCSAHRYEDILRPLSPALAWQFSLGSFLGSSTVVESIHFKCTGINYELLNLKKKIDCYVAYVCFAGYRT